MSVLDTGERGNDNETGLKEGGGIEMSTTVLPFTITIIQSITVTQYTLKLEKNIFTIITI